MQQSTVDNKIGRLHGAAERERLQSPEMVQTMHAARHSAGAKFARIVKTLCRADPTADPPVTACNWYEIELRTDVATPLWSAYYGVYPVGFNVKHAVGAETKTFECLVEHNSHPGKSPSNLTYWKEVAIIKAWVFGYTKDLIESAPWLTVDEEVEVVKQTHPDHADWVWAIKETVFRVQIGSECSLYQNDDPDGFRVMSVYR